MTDLGFSDDELSELQDVFRFFDKDGDGGVTREEMRSIMAGFGHHVTAATLAPLFDHADANGDNHLQFAEFARLVRDLDPEREDHKALHGSLVVFLRIRGGR